MKGLLVYLIGFLALILTLLISFSSSLLPLESSSFRLTLMCSLIGGCGGLVYCLRGLYIHVCAERNWDDKWLLWYYIRPIVSLICGGVSSLFLTVGLIAFEASKSDDASNISFYAFAFIAGLNVDKFILKLEEIAEATWGIKRSRQSRRGKETCDVDRE